MPILRLMPALLCLPALAAPKVDFNRDVAPILSRSCEPCHASILNRATLIARGLLVPGNAANSRFYTSTTLPSSQKRAMPPGGPALPPEAIDILKRWIDEGADWPASISTAAPAKTVKFDEQEEVRRIHDRIAANTAAPTRGAYRVTIPNTAVVYEMLPIPGGTFTMGSTAKPDEQPTHKVQLDAFWMQSHEVTWDEYRLFMFANQAGEVAHKDETVDAVTRPTRPYAEMSFGMGINGFPAISMTQHAANKYAEWLSAKTGEFYRLPTEAEWEYACLADSPTPPAPLADYAWLSANSGGKYQKVATKKANAWGLYDMLGNVMEWTLDLYGPYRAEAAVNPWIQSAQPYPHAVRGGSWNDEPDAVRCSARIGSDPSWKQQDPQLPKSIWYHTDAQWLGFRLVRPAKLPGVEEMFRYWNNGVEHDEQ